MDQNGVQQGQAIIQLSAKSETQTVGLRRRHLRRLRLQGHRRHLRLLVLVSLMMMVMMMMTAVVVVVVVVASVSVVRLFHRRRRRRRQVVVYGLHAHPTPKFVAAVHWAKRLLDTLWITKRRENPRKLQFPTRVQLR